MIGLKTTQFSGILPRVSPSLLPESNAAQATNCDFGYGELRNMKGDARVQALVANAASLYTDDGTTFYSWNEDVDAVRSPLGVDEFDRLYYTTPGDFRVTTRSGMRINGGPPGSSYRVGVPQPLTAPTLTASQADSLDGAAITTTFHYEYSGVKYQEQSAALNVIEPNAKWTLTVPARDAATPEQAFPALKMTAVNAQGETLLSVYSTNSSFAATSIWQLTLEGSTGGTYAVTLAVNYEADEQVTTAYVYTYVNTYGEEGPPSPPATITSASALDTVVGVIRDAQVADYAPIKEIRLYRTARGTTIAQYFYSASINVLTMAGQAFTVTDTTDEAGLNEPLSSENNFPPSPALVGLMLLPNGTLCARKGNQVHFSEAYKAWAWNPANVKTFEHATVSGIVHGSGVLITTTVDAYFVSGVSPDSMTESKVNLSKGAVSKWSIAEVAGLIVYASNDGLVTVDGATASLVPSERFFTRDIWRARYRAGFSALRFAEWDGRLIVYSSTGNIVPFLLRFDEAAGQMSDLPFFYANYTFTSPLADQCYVIRGSEVFQFAGGSDLPATWMSREVVPSYPVNFGVVQVICSGAWTVEIMARMPDDDGYSLVSVEEITRDTVFRLPGGFLSDRWQFKFTGTGRLRELRVAETAADLRKM